MHALRHLRCLNDGFSLVELLVTVLLAGIIFLAMTPMFVGVLKGTSTNSRRVIATNIAQAQLEKIRVLAASPSSYANITNANLNSSLLEPLPDQHHLHASRRGPAVQHQHDCFR